VTSQCALDNNGNTATKADTTGTTQYFWDYENRMSSVTLPGSGGVVTFKYDPFGRRIYKSSSSGTSVYAYDGDNLVEETNSSGAAVARYSQTQNIDEPLAMLRSAATSYFHADGLGSVTSLSNAAGSIANTYTYDSFGKLTASTGSLVNPFRYTARESDTETGLYYYRARYYDQVGGRFNSEDPIGFRAGPNFYRYVNNNPTTLADPFGLQEDPNWFYRWGNRFLGWLLDPPKPKPGTPPPNPINICEAGETALFSEAGPNPYVNGNAGQPAWNAFMMAFNKKCREAKKPGMGTHAVCSAAATGQGAVAYCICCEYCENKK